MVTPTQLEAALTEYASLEHGWNSYDAAPIAPAAIEVARAFARDTTGIPWDCVPTTLGGVQLEIHQYGYDMEIEVKPDGTTWECFYAPLHTDAFKEVESATCAEALAFVREVAG